jgi:hypothetical protein
LKSKTQVELLVGEVTRCYIWESIWKAEGGQEEKEREKEGDRSQEPEDRGQETGGIRRKEEWNEEGEIPPHLPLEKGGVTTLTQPLPSRERRKLKGGEKRWKSANLSTTWNRLVTNRSAAEVLSSAIKAAMSLRSSLALGDQISLRAIP